MNYAGLLTEMALTHLVSLDSWGPGEWTCQLTDRVHEGIVVEEEGSSPEAAVRKAYLVLNGRTIPIQDPIVKPRFK